MQVGDLVTPRKIARGYQGSLIGVPMLVTAICLDGEHARVTYKGMPVRFFRIDSLETINASR
tara:strand:- start:532 stop:717 length:186 start_codon:yes stop_codon:yes gene_type:complete